MGTDNAERNDLYFQERKDKEKTIMFDDIIEGKDTLKPDKCDQPCEECIHNEECNGKIEVEEEYDSVGLGVPSWKQRILDLIKKHLPEVEAW